MSYSSGKLISSAAILLIAATGGAAQGMPPQRDPAIALREELLLAQVADTNAALILFIARHPDAIEAAQARDLLLARGHADAAPPGGPDGTIIAEFDLARLAGTSRAMAAFASRYPTHPLAAEAARPIWAAPH